MQSYKNMIQYWQVQCGKKQPYLTRKAAMVGRMALKHGLEKTGGVFDQTVQPFHCSICGNWHLGRSHRLYQLNPEDRLFIRRSGGNYSLGIILAIQDGPPKRFTIEFPYEDTIEEIRVDALIAQYKKYGELMLP